MPKLGIENGQLKTCPSSPNCVCSFDSDAEHSIKPIQVNGTAEESRNKLLKILANTNRAEVTLNEGLYIRAEFVSRIFRFVDDVEFLLVENSSNETLIHVRSASRLGYSDLGANRKRIEQIRDQF